MHHLGDRKITEMFAQLHQMGDDGFELAHSPNLLAVEGDKFWIGQTLGYGLLSRFAREQRIRTSLDLGTVLSLDEQKLLGERSTPQLLQAGELLEQRLPA